MEGRWDEDRPKNFVDHSLALKASTMRHFKSIHVGFHFALQLNVKTDYCCSFKSTCCRLRQFNPVSIQGLTVINTFPFYRPGDPWIECVIIAIEHNTNPRNPPSRPISNPDQISNPNQPINFSRKKEF